jgi:hypothetical protein
MKIGSVKVKTKEGSTVTTTSSFNTSKEGINNKNNNRAYFNFINSIKSPRSRKTYEFIIKR